MGVEITVTADSAGMATVRVTVGDEAAEGETTTAAIGARAKASAAEVVDWIVLTTGMPLVVSMVLTAVLTSAAAAGKEKGLQAAATKAARREAMAAKEAAKALD